MFKFEVNVKKNVIAVLAFLSTTHKQLTATYCPDILCSMSVHRLMQYFCGILQITSSDIMHARGK